MYRNSTESMLYALPISLFRKVDTPFYYYDTRLLSDTVDDIIASASADSRYNVHYAIKANSNPEVLRLIASKGLGADCVSGGEIRAAIEAGIPAEKIVYAGVGKKDWEIRLALDLGISCFNVESLEELAVINELALSMNKIAPVAFRINPNVDAHTHANITTGLSENKFGIAMTDMVHAVRECISMRGVSFYGLHFHIGSQITDFTPFVELCARVIELRQTLHDAGISMPNINVGGGFGINYEVPDSHPIPDFEGYFSVFRKHLPLEEGQVLHFELGRSVVGQCGTLVSQVIYVKHGATKQFLIVDAGFTDLIRPALYDAYHKVEVLTPYDNTEDIYDVVGPICESSDVFDKDVKLPTARRGDLVGFRSAGAYGEVMASCYNNRVLVSGYTTEQLEKI